MSARSMVLLLASFAALVSATSFLVCGNAESDAGSSSPTATEAPAARPVPADAPPTNVPRVEQRAAATPGPASPPTGESLESSLNRVAVYYESDQVIENFLNPRAFGEYRWHTTFDLEADDGAAVDELQYLLRSSKLDRDTTVLDWGCGMGWLVVHLAKTYGCKATGVNISRRQLDYAERLAEQERVQQLVRFDLYAGKELPYPSDSFDIVYSQESLVHAPDKQLAFGEIYRVLKPGGELSIQDWFADGDNADWHALTRDIDRTYNTFLDTVQHTVRLWEELGFAEIVVVDLREKLGEAFVGPFDGQPFLRAVEAGAFTVAFVSARKPAR